jgi:hypothetical protein
MGRHRSSLRDAARLARCPDETVEKPLAAGTPFSCSTRHSADEPVSRRRETRVGFLRLAEAIIKGRATIDRARSIALQKGTRLDNLLVR